MGGGYVMGVIGMSNLTERRRSGLTMVVIGILAVIGAGVIFFTMAKPFPIWLILIAIGGTFASIGAGMWMDGR